LLTNGFFGAILAKRLWGARQTESFRTKSFGKNEKSSWHWFSAVLS